MTVSPASGRRLLAAAAALLAACSGTPLEPLEYTGTLGVPLPATRVRNTLSVSGQVAGQPVALLIDSGAPVIILPFTPVGSDRSGLTHVQASLLGLELTDLPVVLDSSSLGNPLGAAGPEGAFGLLGGSFLAHFAVTLDYAQATVQLDEFLPVAVPAGEDQVKMSVAGGGHVILSDQSRVPTSATRPLVSLQIEGVATRALIDTGSSITLVSSRLAARWPAGPRPRLEGAQLAGFNQVHGVTYTRADRVQVGSTVSRDNLVGLLQSDGVLEPLRDELGGDLEVILGGSFLREFIVKLDYPVRNLRLAPNPRVADLPRNTVNGVGFFVREDGQGQLVVSHVQAGSPAGQAGVAVGDLLLDFEGTTAAPLGELGINSRLTTAPGRELTMTLQRPGAAARQLSLTSVDLLPTL